MVKKMKRKTSSRWRDMPTYETSYEAALEEAVAGGNTKYAENLICNYGARPWRLSDRLIKSAIGTRKLELVKLLLEYGAVVGDGDRSRMEMVFGDNMVARLFDEEQDSKRLEIGERVFYVREVNGLASTASGILERISGNSFVIDGKEILKERITQVYYELGIIVDNVRGELKKNS